MKYIFGTFGLVIIPFIVNGILSYLKYPVKAEKGKVYLPKFIVILGTIVSVLFFIPMMITVFTHKAFWITCIFLFFSLLGVSLIIAFMNCRIEYNEKDFIVKNFFGIKRKYTYDRIDAIKADMHEDYLIIGKHRVLIDEFAVGGHDFITFVRKQYRKLHNGKALPIIKKGKWDIIFNGNVNNAGEFIFIYALLIVVIIGLGIFMSYKIWFDPYSADNTIEQNVIFVTGIADGDDYIMTDKQENTYKLNYLNKCLNRDKIKSICDSSTELTVYVTETTKKGVTDYWSIKQIMCGDTVLLGFDEYNSLYKKDCAPLILLPVTLVIMIGSIFAGTIIVGRNPKKYRKFIKLFFKDGYVNIE